MRKIIAVTGIRSEYDILYSVLKAIRDHSLLELGVVITGAHLSDSYGNTKALIYNDGFPISDEVESLLDADSPSSRVKGLGIQLQGLVQTVVREKPDILLALGDREESVATALVGAYMNIPVAHLCGGDRVIGNVDDQVRHAVTKLAHLHFTTTQESAERVLRLGEQSFRVHNVGNPGLDRFLEVPTMSAVELSQSIGFPIDDNNPLLLVIQHVISSEVDAAYQQMKITLEAVADLGVRTVLIYPNSDAGGQQMIRAISEFEPISNLYTAKNLPRLEFVNLLRRASCLLGNSSAGILEAPMLRLPVVNVGNRQKGRLHAENVTFIPHDKDLIVSAVHRALFDTAYRQTLLSCSNPYGDGRSSIRIANILATIRIDNCFLVKDITY